MLAPPCSGWKGRLFLIACAPTLHARGDAQAFVIDIPKEGQGPRRLVFAVPVLAEEAPARGPLGAVVLTMAPERGLYPLLTDETVPTRSGEALLFRLEGNEPAYISPFRAPGAGWAASGRSLQELVSKVPEAVEKKDTFDDFGST